MLCELGIGIAPEIRCPRCRQIEDLALAWPLGETRRKRPTDSCSEDWPQAGRQRGRTDRGCEAVLGPHGLFLAKKMMADVRPELFDDVIEGGGFQPGGPVLPRLTQATLLWGVIKVG